MTPTGHRTSTASLTLATEVSSSVRCTRRAQPIGTSGRSMWRVQQLPMAYGAARVQTSLVEIGQRCDSGYVQTAGHANYCCTATTSLPSRYVSISRQIWPHLFMRRVPLAPHGACQRPWFLLQRICRDTRKESASIMLWSPYFRRHAHLPLEMFWPALVDCFV